MKIFLAILFLSVLFLAGIRYIERHSIFFPMKEIAGTPEDLKVAYEDVYFRTEDNRKLNGWFIPAGSEAPSGLTLLLSHGNAGNISHRLDKIAMFRGIGLNVFIYDYRHAVVVVPHLGKELVNMLGLRGEVGGADEVIDDTPVVDGTPG